MSQEDWEDVAASMTRLAEMYEREGLTDSARTAREAVALARTEVARLRESGPPTEILVRDDAGREATLDPGSDRLARGAAWAAIWLWQHTTIRDHGGRRALVAAVRALGAARRTADFVRRG